MSFNAAFAEIYWEHFLPLLYILVPFKSQNLASFILDIFGKTVGEYLISRKTLSPVQLISALKIIHINMWKKICSNLLES